MKINARIFQNLHIGKYVSVLGISMSSLFTTLSAEAQSLQCAPKKPPTKQDQIQKLPSDEQKWIEEQLKKNRKPMHFHDLDDDLDDDMKPIVDPPAHIEMNNIPLKPTEPLDHKVQEFFRLTRDSVLYEKPWQISPPSTDEVKILEKEFKDIYQKAKKNGTLDSTLISGLSYETSPVEYVEEMAPHHSTVYVYTLGGHPLFKIFLKQCKDGEQEILEYILWHSEQPIRGRKN